MPPFLARDSRIDVRLGSGTYYRRFDSFDADIVYGVPRDRGVTVVSLGEEWVVPLCSPALAEALRTPAELMLQTFIESDNKRIRGWTGLPRTT